MMLGLRTEPDHGGEGWLDAIAYRAEVHQATGMVSIQLDISTQAALARMRAHAFVHDQLLTDVARDVVARRLAFTENME
jgi:AmiR/NasT family two-component response regulator